MNIKEYLEKRKVGVFKQARTLLDRNADAKLLMTWELSYGINDKLYMWGIVFRGKKGKLFAVYNGRVVDAVRFVQNFTTMKLNIATDMNDNEKASLMLQGM